MSTEEDVEDEQKNLVAGGYSKHVYLVLQGVLAQNAQCFCLGN